MLALVVDIGVRSTYVVGPAKAVTGGSIGCASSRALMRSYTAPGIQPVVVGNHNVVFVHSVFIALDAQTGLPMLCTVLVHCQSSHMQGFEAVVVQHVAVRTCVVEGNSYCDSHSSYGRTVIVPNEPVFLNLISNSLIFNINSTHMQRVFFFRLRIKNRPCHSKMVYSAGVDPCYIADELCRVNRKGFGGCRPQGTDTVAQPLKTAQLVMLAGGIFIKTRSTYTKT